MKQRISGRVEGDKYVVRAPDGVPTMECSIDVARTLPALKAAIKRNGWEAVPEE